jgi:non-ribosomal peptide synthetase component F
MREVAELYDAFRSGRPSPLPELAVQYADFAAWQRGWLKGEPLDRQLAYWRTKLDRLPLLELPTDRPRPQVQMLDGASVQATIPRALADRLKRVAREEGATLFHVLLAGFAVLLHHVTGADDLPIGSPVANRGRRELEALVGFFVNTVILRVDLSGRPTGRDLVRRVRELSLDASAHQDLPFEQLVAELQPERDLSRHALFQTVFVLQDTPVERQEIQGLTLRQLELASWHVKFDLVINMWDSQDGLVVWAEYATALFERATIVSLIARYERVLAALAGGLDRPVDDLELLAPDELALLAADASVPALSHDFAFAS